MSIVFDPPAPRARLARSTRYGAVRRPSSSIFVARRVDSQRRLRDRRNDRICSSSRTDAGGPADRTDDLLPVSPDRRPAGVRLPGAVDPIRRRTHATAMTRRPIIGVGAVAGRRRDRPRDSLSAWPAARRRPARRPRRRRRRAGGLGASASAAAAPTSRPVPGHEVFGFVPYWEMNDDIADHLAEDRR